MTNLIQHLLILSLLIQNLLFAQIRITPLPPNKEGVFDNQFFDKNELRDVSILNTDWNVYYESDPQTRVSVSLPAIFEGKESLVFEKQIVFTSDQIKNRQTRLGFLGLNYSCEISVNGYNIYKHIGGAYPFEIGLPNDILKENENNTITVKVSGKLDSENSIPVLQRYLFPSVKSGIIRDVYIKTIPMLHIAVANPVSELDQSLSKANISFELNVENSSFSRKSYQGSTEKNFYLRINIYAEGSATPQSKGDYLESINSEVKEFNVQLEVINPQLWSPETPNYYLCEISIVSDGQVIDKTVRQFSFFQITKKDSELFLNGNRFEFKGTTYFLNETDLRKINSYEQIRDDLSLIKATGFNVVRFAKMFPNPYALKLCQELGLLVLIELPINSVPEEILQSKDFETRAKASLNEFSANYSRFSNALMIGAGSSYLPNSTVTSNFIAQLSKITKERNFFSYASFSGVPKTAIEDLDFYGIELFSPGIEHIKEELPKAVEVIGNSSLFISEITYPNYKGNSNGYLTKNSAEAQAKYLEDFLNFSSRFKYSGFIINSLFEYKGAFPSLYSGYADNGLYTFGILDYSRNLNDITYRILFSKLNYDARVTIPIGSKKDDSPIIFILISLFLAVLLAVLINTKKKFREDCSRALLRPYNFFADIRDHRILSGIHTVIMMFIEAGALSLLITIILFYFKANILADKILLAFGSAALMKSFIYLCWNPQTCFLIVIIILIIKFSLLSLIIKCASFFIRTRVELSNIFYSVVWAFLPYTLLLPLELILYRLLGNGSFNMLLLALFILFFVWNIQRLLKGIYVIFDLRPFIVYFYTLLIILVTVGGLIIKFQLSSSTIYYITNSIKQYKSMIF